MKRQWEIEELIEKFTLMPSELVLIPDEIANATPHNRLGFAVLLKFFQADGRFPHHAGEVPKAVVSFITQQLKLSEEDYRQYKWSGRTIKTHPKPNPYLPRLWADDSERKTTAKALANR